VEGEFVAQQVGERLGAIALDREVVDLEVPILDPVDHHNFHAFGVIGTVRIDKSEVPRQLLDRPIGLRQVDRCPAVLLGELLDVRAPERFAGNELDEVGDVTLSCCLGLYSAG